MMNKDHYLRQTCNSRISLPILFVRQLNCASTVEEILHCVALWLPHVIEADRASICLGPSSLGPSSLGTSSFVTAQKTALKLPPNHLRVFAFVGKEAIPQDMPIPIEKTQVGRAFKDQTPLRCDDCGQSGAIDCQLLSKAGMNTVLNAPLRKNGFCFGTLNVAHSGKEFYGHQDLITLQCLADWVTQYLFIQLRTEPPTTESLSDSLTGVANRRFFFDQGICLFGRWRRRQNPYSLAVLGVDLSERTHHFHTPEASDEILKHVSKHTIHLIRSEDMLARISYDIFSLLLPETPMQAAKAIINRTQDAISGNQLKHNGKCLPIALSAGISQVHEQDACFDDTVLRANSALHLAKAKGTRGICIHNLP